MQAVFEADGSFKGKCCCKGAAAKRLQTHLPARCHCLLARRWHNKQKYGS